jgi:heme exporter protein B
MDLVLKATKRECLWFDSWETVNFHAERKEDSMKRKKGISNIATWWSQCETLNIEYRSKGNKQLTLRRMSIISQTGNLIKREILLEQRQKYAFYGVLLYVISTVFVCKFSFMGKFDFAAVRNPVFIKRFPGTADLILQTMTTTWNALFWIILLFASVTAGARSFSQESRGRLLYIYTLADPRSVFLAKLFYNIFLMIFLSLVGLTIYSFFIGYPVANNALFFETLILGSCGLAAAFTMISAIASKAGNNFTLMSILGFPIVIPLIMLTIKISSHAVDGLFWLEQWNYLGALGLLNVLVIAISYLLFPYLWRD